MRTRQLRRPHAHGWHDSARGASPAQCLLSPTASPAWKTAHPGSQKQIKRHPTHTLDPTLRHESCHQPPSQLNPRKGSAWVVIATLVLRFEPNAKQASFNGAASSMRFNGCVSKQTLEIESTRVNTRQSGTLSPQMRLNMLKLCRRPRRSVPRNLSEMDLSQGPVNL